MSYQSYAPPASVVARHLLGTASQRMNTANPVQVLGNVLDASLPYPVGHRAYTEPNRSLEATFAETMPNTLAFTLAPAEAGSTPRDRLEQTVHTMRQLTLGGFGSEALRWADSRLAPLREGHLRSTTWGATLGTGFDRNGIVESSITCEWGPGLMDALPAPLYQIARIAAESLPGLRPSLSTIRCGRSSGSQQITFEVTQALPLQHLKTLMDALQLGHQHASLMSACAFALGARFTLPPNTSAITLRPTRNGVEMRLDVDLDSLPDVPAQLASLLRLQMAERPSSLRSLDRWLTALTPDGYPGPGDFTILSIWVRPEMPARVALYLRPSALETPPAASVNGTASNGQVIVVAPASASASSYWG